MQNRPYNLGKQSILVASRLLATAIITAFIGAFLNFFYRKFFDPEAYAAGPPVTRAIFSYALTIPFVLLALIIVGLPTSYLLRRLGLENWLIYALVGAALGVGFLYAVLSYLTPFGIGAGAIYGSICAIIWFALSRKF
jgi:hypothetical protein